MKLGTKKLDMQKLLAPLALVILYIFFSFVGNNFFTWDTAQNILVVKTVSGMAMAVAAALDNMQCDEIVGSIAGDDTIMCAVRTSAEAQSLLTRLKKLATE